MFARMAKYSTKIVLVATMFVALSTGFSVHSLAHAQSMDHQTFVVLAGGAGPANMDLLEFFPKDIQVHRGDTITWLINGFHNISIVGTSMDENAAEQLVVSSEINGQQTAYFNPEATTPTVHSGDTYTGGPAESGLPVPTPTLSLVIDADAGTYYYHCDVHYGAPDAEQHMEGSFTVVDDSTTIPSPTDVMLEAGKEIGDAVNQGMGAYASAEQQSMSASTSDGATVTVGSQAGLATVNQFFPLVAVITAGQTVTWSNTSANELHTVSWPPLPEDQQMAPATDANGNPILELKPALVAPTLQNGDNWVTDSPVNSGLIMPGQTFTATFPDPGVYPYVCLIHPGMSGVVVVMPGM